MRQILVAALLAGSSPAIAQPRSDPAALIAAQKAAMAPLERLDGVWRGTAWTLAPDGRHDVTHTERVGPFLDGTVKVIEGRAYKADGSVGFNAFGIISYDPAKKAFTLQSYAQGRSGSFPIEILPDGYVWQVPAGPGAIIRYTATVKDGRWREVGERIAGSSPPVQTFEMNLRRVGSTRWPGGEAVPRK